MTYSTGQWSLGTWAAATWTANWSDAIAGLDFSHTNSSQYVPLLQFYLIY